MASIDRIRRHPKVEIVDDERGLGNGIIVTLKAGWTFSAGEDNRVRGEDTVREAREMLRDAVRFTGTLFA